MCSRWICLLGVVNTPLEATRKIRLDDYAERFC